MSTDEYAAAQRAQGRPDARVVLDLGSDQFLVIALPEHMAFGHADILSAAAAS
jgi:hypothetical protein